MSSKALYFQGKYEETIEFAEKTALEEDLVFKIGALYILGNEEEAEALSSGRDWTSNNEIILVFFETLNLIRRAQYDKAKTNISKSYFLLQKTKSNRFYCYQLLGFYRYFSGSFTKSLSHALKALRACDDEDLVYEKIYCMEIIGHIYFQRGEFYKSIDFLEQTYSYALKMKCTGTAKAIETNIIGYKLESGFELDKNILLAEKIIKNSKTKEYYLLGQIQLQLAKAYMFKGENDLGIKTLQEASYNIYRTKNHRQSINLNLSLANQHVKNKEYQNALFLIESAKQFVQEEIDKILKLRLISKEINILKLMNKPTADLEKEKSHLARNSSFFLEKINQYRNGIKSDISLISDPIFLTLRNENLTRFPTKNLILKLDSLNLLGLLHFFSFSQNQSTQLIFGIKKHRILIIHNHNIFWSNSKMTKFQYQFVKFIARSKKVSKKELVEKIWNYHYIDYQHDPLVYNLIARLKKADPRLGNFIKTFNDVFLEEKIICRGLEQKKLTQIRNPKTISDPINQKKDINLNFRQIQLLESVNSGTLFSPKDYISLFEVSRITATRDLKHLKDEGYIKPLGKARGLKYLVN